MYQRIGAAAYKADLDNTLALCESLGNPERKFKSIHVAGTNGKGSTSHMLAAILQAAGYRTGLYTSPHLKEFTERIRIDGREIEQDFVVDFVDRMRPELDRIQPSFFEMTVGMAFDYFARRQVDVAVIEVGLGGRLDSTNVITPELSVITNISWDHMALLGNTLQKIASEKAGIIKRGVPVVVSERQEEVEDVFIGRAGQLGCDLVFASDIIQLHQQSDGYDVYQGGGVWLEGLNPGLKGRYQEKNLPGVLAAVLALTDLGYEISNEAIKEGIAHTTQLTGLKGRWQIIRQNPLTICDTGHNEAGILAVLDQLRETPHRRLHMVIGMVNDKDISKILNLLPKEAVYYFCQARIPRAMDARELAGQAASFGLKGVVEPDVNAALRKATAEAGPGDVIFVGGSTFVVGEVDGI
ncbi:MAG: bifunctional folylpolyglutamate synthase/dihydrofolate synthase [Cyclobacteriaceae bacterium]|nr:bifunctional folylpolyglutamate synthase/dihydrofolate synthase [Cyclobacteriaceae bacterium]